MLTIRTPRVLKKFILLALFLIVITLSIANSVFAIDYFSYQMNFPPGEQRNHTQNVTYTGKSLKLTIPENFTLVDRSSGGKLSGNQLSWGWGDNKTINYTLTSPSNCTIGDVYYSDIWINNSYYNDSFVFVCIPDNKIVDYKLEYGHGDANYLTEEYISNESAILFNLVRVFNIGHYFDKDEVAYNASINCTFEKYLIRTYGRVEVEHYDNYINASFLWDIIESGYWFRIGVLSQEVYGKSVGAFYTINCTDLTYDFAHGRVKAGFTNKSIEVRSTNPFQINVTLNKNKLTYTIQNTEKYPVDYLVFKWNTGEYTKIEYLNKLEPNEEVNFDIVLEGNGSLNLDIDFIPSWYANSRNPKIYTQTKTHVYRINNETQEIIIEEEIDNETKEIIVEKIGEIQIVDYPKFIELEINESGAEEVKVKNIGNSTLHNVKLIVSGLPSYLYQVTPKTVDIEPGEMQTFSAKINSSLEEKQYLIKFIATSDEDRKEESSVLNIVEKVYGKPLIPKIEAKPLTLLLIALILLALALLGFILMRRRKLRKELESLIALVILALTILGFILIKEKKSQKKLKKAKKKKLKSIKKKKPIRKPRKKTVKRIKKKKSTGKPKEFRKTKKKKPQKSKKLRKTKHK